MKRMFLMTVSLGVLGFAAPALAADLPMYAKAPAIVAPVYDWSGFYVGDGTDAAGFFNAEFFASGCRPLNTSADHSVGLGLIVTELVINALKHAFPRRDQSGGHIVVDYASDGDSWAMSVSDDGVGMPPENLRAKPGLGTGIVEALSA